MGSFEILPHTADVRLRVKGETLEDLFEQAVLGLSDILKSGECSTFNVEQIGVTKIINISADNLTVLLIDFLSEVLTTSYEEKAVFCKAKFSKLTKVEFQVKIFGNKADGFDEDIKAVTYHEAKIIKTDKGFETIIIFDI